MRPELVVEALHEQVDPSVQRRPQGILIEFGLAPSNLAK
jgi:hypothetical protein